MAKRHQRVGTFKSLNERFHDLAVHLRGRRNEIFVPLNGFWPLRGEGVSTKSSIVSN